MPHYWSLPYPLKICLNIFAFILIFVVVSNISPSLSLLGAILTFLLSLFSISLLLFFFLENSFHVGVITFLVLSLFSNFRLFVVELAMTLLFYFLKTFTSDLYSKHSRQLVSEKNKKLITVLQTKISEYKFIERYLLSVFTVTSFFTVTIFLLWSLQKGEVDYVFFSKSILTELLLSLFLIGSSTRRVNSA